VPGYVFNVADGGTHIGYFTVLITPDRDAVARVGHMGCELEPPFRKKGYVARMGRGLFPFVREQGLREVLITCDVGHASQRQSILDTGASPLDVLPAAAGDPAKERFLFTFS
jgi:predicted acetyltransferase